MNSAVKVILILFGLFVLGLGVLMGGFMLIDNSREVVKTAYSPDGKYVAYAFSVDMGATTRRYYHLSVLRRGRRINAFSCGNVIRSSMGLPETRWTGNRTLTVDGSSGPVPVRKVYDVNIVYQ